MKKILLLLSLVISTSGMAQTLYNEDFESYQGFGSSLLPQWPTTNFKVYINHGTNGSKGCASLFNNLHKVDSLISPDLGAISGGVRLDFDARLGGDIIAGVPTAGYLPKPNDHIWFYSSVDGQPYQLVQEITNQFVNTNASFTNLSIPVPASSTNSMQLKIKVSKAQAVSNQDEFYLDMDNFAVNLLTPVSYRQTADYSVGLMPNPNSGICNLTLGDGWTSKTQVEIFNILGTKIGEVQPQNGKAIINLEGQKPGIYLIKVSEGSVVQVKRVILK